MKAINSKPFVLVLATLLSVSALKAQTFNSGSNGSDGALDLTGQAGTIVFNPNNFTPPLDPDHDNVFHFTTIKIPSGLTVRLSADVLGVKPVVWLASGLVEIRGVLDLKGQNGNNFQGPAMPSIAGAGGYSGGASATSTTPFQRGLGPGGAPGAGGGGGHAVVGGGVNGVGGAAYGNDFLLPLVGGSGGAGWSTNGGGGGGAGGGAILIASSGTISFFSGSQVNASGGLGYGGCLETSSNPSGGGGSGGAIRLIASSITGVTSLFAEGGQACPGSGIGSKGRIRIEAFQRNISGTISPAPLVGTPSAIFPPASAPSVRIVNIGGIAVSENPTGSFIFPDVTLDDATTVAIQLAANKVPVGTIVHLTLTPETGSIQTVDSTPLAGTFDSSTATASITIPHGFSRFSVQASWTP